MNAPIAPKQSETSDDRELVEEGRKLLSTAKLPWAVSGGRSNYDVRNAHSIGPDGDAFMLVMMGRTDDEFREGWNSAQLVKFAVNSLPAALDRIEGLSAALADANTRISRHRFQVGDPVEVSSICRYYGDWLGAELFISGVMSNWRTGEITYETADEWPPLNSRADGWSECDLSPRALTPATEKEPGR